MRFRFTTQAFFLMNCYQAKTGELAKQWYVIDASGQVVGRLAAQIAPILMGKHRPTYTAHIDTGDYVIVTNVDKVVFTGNKWQDKTYQRYSGYPGGQRDEAAWKMFQRHPERILELAIKRMMPKNKLGRQMMDKLKLHVGSDHPHQAQQPIPLEALSGRPTPSGVLLAPAPAAPGSRKKAAKAKSEDTAAEAGSKAVVTAHAHDHDHTAHAHEHGHVHEHTAEAHEDTAEAHEHTAEAHEHAAEAHEAAPAAEPTTQ
jgi:large subunit ribosomal protein L13